MINRDNLAVLTTDNIHRIKLIANLSRTLLYNEKDYIYRLHFNVDNLISIRISDHKVSLYHLDTQKVENRITLASRSVFSSSKVAANERGRKKLKGFYVQDLKTGEIILSKLFSDTMRYPIRFTPDEKTLLVCSHKFFQDEHPMDPNRMIEVPNIAPSGHSVPEIDYYITMLNLETGEESLFLSLSTPERLSISPDNRWYLRSMLGQGVSVFECETHYLRYTVYPHYDRLTSIIWSQDSRYFAVLTADIEVWEAETGTPILHIRDARASHVYFSPDNRFLIFESYINREVNVIIWNMEANQKRGTLFADIYRSFVLHPIANIIALYKAGEIELWNIDTMRFAKALNIKNLKNNVAAFNPDGKLLAVADDSTIGLWGVDTKQPILSRLRDDFVKGVRNALP